MCSIVTSDILTCSSEGHIAPVRKFPCFPVFLAVSVRIPLDMWRPVCLISCVTHWNRQDPLPTAPAGSCHPHRLVLLVGRHRRSGLVFLQSRAVRLPCGPGLPCPSPAHRPVLHGRRCARGRFGEGLRGLTAHRLPCGEASESQGRGGVRRTAAAAETHGDLPGDGATRRNDAGLGHQRTRLCPGAGRVAQHLPREPAVRRPPGSGGRGRRGKRTFATLEGGPASGEGTGLPRCRGAPAGFHGDEGGGRSPLRHEGPCGRERRGPCGPADAAAGGSPRDGASRLASAGGVLRSLDRPHPAGLHDPGPGAHAGETALPGGPGNGVFCGVSTDARRSRP